MKRPPQRDITTAITGPLPAPPAIVTHAIFVPLFDTQEGHHTMNSRLSAVPSPPQMPALPDDPAKALDAAAKALGLPDATKHPGARRRTHRVHQRRRRDVAAGHRGRRQASGALAEGGHDALDNARAVRRRRRPLRRREEARPLTHHHHRRNTNTMHDKITEALNAMTAARAAWKSGSTDRATALALHDEWLAACAAWRALTAEAAKKGG